MEFGLAALGAVALILYCLICSLLLFIGFPGTILIAFGAGVYGYWTSFAALTGTTVAWLCFLAAAGEFFELYATTRGPEGVRLSDRVSILTIIGALIGGIVGAAFLFGVGSLIGALLGAFAAATLATRASGNTMGDSIRAGYTALKGRFLGFVAKTAIAATMVIIVAMRLIQGGSA